MPTIQEPGNYGSGTSSGPGFGNKTSGDSSETFGTDDTRFGSHGNTDSYSGGTDYGSGTTAGVGFGNKSARDGDYSQEHEVTRYGSGGETGAYAGGTEYGSGTTGGAGFGNKTSGSGGESNGMLMSKPMNDDSLTHLLVDSFAGKVMEKAGNMLHNESLAEKGREKREEKGFGQSGEGNV
ncbi:MAG: hypothetical protein Q9157_006320 [Trypethelium eluteriae]